MPASYPTAPKTFTTKQPTDTPAASFVNDLQLEVEAISSGLLAGTARLNSSRSTMAALSVPGASTLASLQVDSNCVIAGTLTAGKIVSTSVSGRSVMSYVSAYIGSSTATLIFEVTATTQHLQFDQEIEDRLSEWDSTAFTFTPKSSGFYRVEAQWRPTLANMGWETITMRVNDTLYALQTLPQPTAQITVPQISAVVRLSSGAAGQIVICAYAGGTCPFSTGLSQSFLRITRLW